MVKALGLGSACRLLDVRGRHFSALGVTSRSTTSGHDVFDTVRLRRPFLPWGANEALGTHAWTSRRSGELETEPDVPALWSKGGRRRGRRGRGLHPSRRRPRPPGVEVLCLRFRLRRQGREYRGGPCRPVGGDRGPLRPRTPAGRRGSSVDSREAVPGSTRLTTARARQSDRTRENRNAASVARDRL